MTRVLLLHGPNLNVLGRRDPRHYPPIAFDELVRRVRAWGAEIGFDLVSFQSNSEGALIDALQARHADTAGAVVNAGALTHTSYALHDALLDYAHPAVEVHLTRVSEREPWRRVSAIRAACVAHVEGLGPDGYRQALEILRSHLSAPR